MVGRLSRKLIFALLSIALLAGSCQHRPKHRDRTRTPRAERTERQTERVNTNGEIRVPFELENGVYYLKVKVNDVPMKFIFDTGASIISISLTEAQFLYKQGTLTDDDFVDIIQFQDANGDVTESMLVMLRELEIGGVVLHNVEASIVANQTAPLLLGQSALKQFKKVSIDYQRNQLILE